MMVLQACHAIPCAPIINGIALNQLELLKAVPETYLTLTRDNDLCVVISCFEYKPSVLQQQRDVVIRQSKQSWQMQT